MSPSDREWRVTGPTGVTIGYVGYDLLEATFRSWVLDTDGVRHELRERASREQAVEIIRHITGDLPLSSDPVDVEFAVRIAAELAEQMDWPDFEAGAPPTGAMLQ